MTTLSFIRTIKFLVFLLANWLPHDQLWLLSQEAATINHCQSLRFLFDFLLKRLKGVGTLSPAEDTVAFELATFLF